MLRSDCVFLGKLVAYRLHSLEEKGQYGRVRSKGPEEWRSSRSNRSSSSSSFPSPALLSTLHLAARLPPFQPLSTTILLTNGSTPTFCFPLTLPGHNIPSASKSSSTCGLLPGATGCMHAGCKLGSDRAANRQPIYGAMPFGFALFQ